MHVLKRENSAINAIHTHTHTPTHSCVPTGQQNPSWSDRKISSEKGSVGPGLEGRVRGDQKSVHSKCDHWSFTVISSHPWADKQWLVLKRWRVKITVNRLLMNIYSIYHPLTTHTHTHTHTHTQALSQHFAEGIEQIRHCQNLLVNHELANWSQSQRLFSFEDDRGKLELNNMQQWWAEYHCIAPNFRICDFTVEGYINP